MNELTRRIATRTMELLSSVGINIEMERAEKLVLEISRKLLFWVPVILVYGMVFAIAGIVNLVADPVKIFGEEHGKGTILLYGLLLYTAAGLRSIGPKELGCRLLFGKPIDNVSSGFTFVPRGIYQLAKETRLVIQDELPTDPEKIYRGGGDDDAGKTVPKDLQALGWKPPIRVTFSGRNQESVDESIPEDDPYDRRLTAEVVPVVRWRITDFTTFLGAIGSVMEARRQMEDTSVGTFNQHLTKVSPAVALRRLDYYSRKLKGALDELVEESWGIDVENAWIKAINFSHKLNTAVQKVVEEERNMVASIRQGEGLGGKEKAILDGRTAGLENMKNKLGISGEAVVGAETARAVAGEGDKSSQRTIIAGSGGFADLIGTAVAIGESLKPKQQGGKS